MVDAPAYPPLKVTSEIVSNCGEPRAVFIHWVSLSFCCRKDVVAVLSAHVASEDECQPQQAIKYFSRTIRATRIVKDTAKAVDACRWQI